MTAATALMPLRLVWLAWRELPIRAPIRRRLICHLAQVCDDNLADL